MTTYVLWIDRNLVGEYADETAALQAVGAILAANPALDPAELWLEREQPDTESQVIAEGAALVRRAREKHAA